MKDEDVRGYWVAGSLICKECIDADETEGMDEENIFTESNMDEGAEYFCSRCKKRI